MSMGQKAGSIGHRALGIGHRAGSRQQRTGSRQHKAVSGENCVDHGIATAENSPSSVKRDVISPPAGGRMRRW